MALGKCVEVTACSPAFLLGNGFRPRGIIAGSRPTATAFVAAARKAALIVPGLGPVLGQLGRVDGLGDWSLGDWALVSVWRLRLVLPPFCLETG